MLPSHVIDETNLKKCKTYEEQNTHCILPEGLRHARKKGHHTEGAEGENTAGPKKANAKQKGRGKKGK